MKQVEKVSNTRNVYFYLDNDWQVWASDDIPNNSDTYVNRDISHKEYLALCNGDMRLANTVIWSLKQRYFDEQVHRQKNKILNNL